MFQNPGDKFFGVGFSDAESLGGGHGHLAPDALAAVEDVLREGGGGVLLCRVFFGDVLVGGADFFAGDVVAGGAALGVGESLVGAGGRCAQAGDNHKQRNNF